LQEFFPTVQGELAAGGDLCLATIVAQKGSAPRSLGTRFFVRPDGSFWGTIGGGCLESRVIEEARQALAKGRSVLMHHRLLGRDAADVEMICGGDLMVYLEPLLGGDEMAVELFQEAARVQAKGGRAVLATLVEPGPVDGLAGRKLLMVQNGPTIGFLADHEELNRELAAYLGAIKPHQLPQLLDSPALGPEGQVFVDPIVGGPVVYIFGGGHVAKQIAPLVKLMGFGLVVADDRVEWANPERFPQAGEIWNQDLDRVLEGKRLGSEAYLVIVTRGHLFDKDVLAQCLRQKAAYVGMIGSKRKRQLVYKALLEEGFSQEELNAVYSPIGLDIGAETPEEIALAIAAELVAVRAQLGKGDQ
jgi:xanthine dehydrogenase accessory factor